MKFIKNNPKLLNKYVQFLMKVSKLLLELPTKILHHLIVIQGLDPNVDPKIKRNQDLLKSLNDMFERFDSKSYHDDFDFKNISSYESGFPIKYDKDGYKIKNYENLFKHLDNSHPDLLRAIKDEKS